MIPCYIFDIDGTLADGAHRVHHIQSPDGTLARKKDWDAYFAACGGDKPIAHVVDLYQRLRDSDVVILLVSGRSEVCRMETKAWIEEHVTISCPPLFMRPAKDFRSDDIIKGEILDQILAMGYQPIMAFDDRDRVVAMWRARGIPCAQVAPGAF